MLFVPNLRAVDNNYANTVPLISIPLYPSGVPLDWYMRDLPYSYDILIENLTDPAHLPFSHHKLAPNLTRDKGRALPMTPVHVEQQQPQQLQQQPTGDSEPAGGGSNGETSGRGTSGSAAPVQQRPAAAPHWSVPGGTGGTVYAYHFPSSLSPDGVVAFNAPSGVVYTYKLPVRL